MPLRVRPSSTGFDDAAATRYMCQWHGITMARAHAFLPAVRDIATHQSYNDLTTISIIGREGTGKSTLMAVLAHHLHEELAKRAAGKVGNLTAEAKISLERPYKVFWFGDEDLINFQKTIDELPAVNRIMVFDDVSFLSGGISKKDMDKIKKTMTVIRHGKTGEDFRTVLLFSYHYSKSLDKFLRDTSYRFVTSVGAEEVDNHIAFFGKSNSRKIRKYKDTMALFTRGQDVKFPVGLGKHTRSLTYKYRDPFGLALYHDGSNLRWIVYPSYDLTVPGSCVHCLHPDIKKRKAALRMHDSDYHKVHAFIAHHCGPNIAVKAANLIGFSRYGRPMYIQGNDLRKALEIFRRLDRDASFSMDDYLNCMVTDKIPRKNGKISPRWSTPLKQEIQDDYKEKFGIDALRSMTET